MSRIPPSLWLAPLLLLPAVVQAQEPDPRELFERGYFQEHALKQLDQAIGTYRRVAELAGEKDRPLAGRALVRLAACEQARGRDVEAREVLQDVLQRFADVPAVKQEAEQLLGQAKGPRRSLRLYDVQDLLTSILDYPAPGATLVPGRSQSAGGGASGGFSFDDEDVPAGRSLDPDQLLELIVRNVDEDSWSNDRNAIQVEGGRLIVTQTAEVQQRIAGYLERLRALRGRVITLEVTLAALEPGLARQLASVSGPLPDAQVAALEQRLRGGQPGARLLARERVAAWDRQTVHASALRELSWLRPRVDQEGVVPTLQTEVARGDEGFLAELRPALVAEGHLLLNVSAGWSRWAIRERAVQTGDLSWPAERRTGDVLQLPRSDLLLIEGTQLMRVGGTHLVGVTRAPRFAQEGLADPYLALLVRAELGKLATGQADAPGSNESRVMRIHDVGLLLSARAPRDLLGVADLYYADEEEEEGRGGAIEPNTLKELIERNVAPESWTSDLNSIEVLREGALVVVSTPEVQAQVAGFLRALERERGRTLSIELERLALGADELAKLLEGARAAGPGAFVVPAAAVAALETDPQRVLGWAGATTWEDHPVRLRERGYQEYLAGHRRCSGGTGMVVGTLTLPVTEVKEEGTKLEISARLTPDRAHATVDLALYLSQLEPFVEAPTSTGPIELPRRRARDHHSSVTFPIDQVLVVGASVGDPADPLRGVVLLRVRAKNLLGGE